MNGQIERQQAMIDEMNEREAPDGETALGLLQAVYRNKRVPLHTRIRCASLAIGYESPKLAVTGVVHDDASFAVALERAISRSREQSVTLDAGKVLELTATDDGAGKGPNGGAGRVPSAPAATTFRRPRVQMPRPSPYPPIAEAVILARQQAHRIIVRKIKAQGRIPLSTLTSATLSRLAIELVEQRPDLVAEALVRPRGPFLPCCAGVHL